MLRALVAVDRSATPITFVEHQLSDAVHRFEVEYADTVAAAIERLGDGTAFDAILIDLSVPDADGASTVSVIQAAAPATAIVVLGRTEDDVAALDSIRAGAQDCLVRTCLLEGCSTAGRVLRRSLRHAIERKRAEKLIAFMANHDPLTGLTNRSLFQSTLEHALARARRAGDRVAVLFLDLDRFKSINDRFGHDAGDKLLQQVARRLEGCLREQDTVARLGGDEFLVLIEGLRTTDHAVVVARTIRRAMERRFRIGSHRMSCSASIGIALSPPSGHIAPATLVARADAAMYRAKSQHADYELSPGAEPTVSPASGSMP